MGKIRIKSLGDEEKEKKQKAGDEARREGKKAIKSRASEGSGRQTDQIGEKTKSGEIPVPEAKVKPEEKTTEVKSEAKQQVKKSRTDIFLPRHKHGKKYLQVRSFVDKTKLYPIAEAVGLLKKMKIASFDETVEVHINTTEKGLKGNVTYPYETGKKTRIAVVDDGLIRDIESGKINFDVLISHPSFMPKLAKLAKILGPRGLMPNPKNGTISDKPEELVKKISGASSFKTEPNFPIIHTLIGKISFPEKNLEENFEALIKAIGNQKVISVFIKTTMSPSVKVETCIKN